MLKIYIFKIFFGVLLEVFKENRVEHFEIGKIYFESILFFRI